MKRLSTLFFVLFVVICNAQTYRYIYEYKITGKKIQNIVLDINPEDVRVYEYGFLESDSITQRSKYENRFFTRASSSGQVIYRKRNSSENITLLSVGQDAFSIKTNDELEWKLHNETKDYQSHKLQKASTTFGGRNWTAWYSPDIPLQEGPYKFKGLLGLIFEIYDDENLFSYHLIKNTNLQDTYTNSDKWMLTYYDQKYIPITKQQWKKLKENADSNPFKDLYESLKKGNKITINNQEITSIDQLDKMAKELRDKRKNAKTLTIEKED